MENGIKALIQQLESIARENGDEFEYRIRIETSGKSLSYRFEAIETADHHTFLDGFGNTIGAAIKQAEENIEGACKAWGYTK